MTRRRLAFAPCACRPLKRSSMLSCAYCLRGAPTLVAACGHAFHVRCLRGWLDRSSCCPVCRTRVDDPRKWLYWKDAWGRVCVRGDWDIML